MKKIKLVAFVLAAIMLSMCVVSCAKVEKIPVKGTISVVIEGETKFGPYEVTVEGTAEDMPTVLDAVMYALEMNEVPFEVDNQDDPKGITSITLDGAEYATKTDDANIYGWTYTANGEEPKSGRMGVNLLNEGDVIVLTYFAQAKE